MRAGVIARDFRVAGQYPVAHFFDGSRNIGKRLGALKADSYLSSRLRAFQQKFRLNEREGAYFLSDIQVVVSFFLGGHVSLLYY